MALAETIADLEAFAREGHFGAALTPRVERFDVPARVLLGQTVMLSWQAANAQHVELWLSGALQGRRVVPPIGRWSLRADQSGLATAELHCWSDAGAQQARADCIETARVRIAAPPVAMNLSATTLRGAPGARVVLRWEVAGAARVELRRPLTSERLQVTACGAAEFVLDCLEEVVELHATGHEASSAAHAVCRLCPDVQPLLDIDSELFAITDPLPELMPWN